MCLTSGQGLSAQVIAIIEDDCSLVLLDSEADASFIVTASGCAPPAKCHQ